MATAVAQVMFATVTAEAVPTAIAEAVIKTQTAEAARATPTPTDTPTSTPVPLPPGWKLYEGADKSFSVGYDSSWQIKHEETHVVTFKINDSQTIWLIAEDILTLDVEKDPGMHLMMNIYRIFSEPDNVFSPPIESGAWGDDAHHGYFTEYLFYYKEEGAQKGGYRIAVAIPRSLDWYALIIYFHDDVKEITNEERELLHTFSNTLRFLPPEELARIATPRPTPTPAPTSTPLPTPLPPDTWARLPPPVLPAGWELYRSPAGDFSVGYKADWEPVVTEDEIGTKFVLPKEETGINVFHKEDTLEFSRDKDPSNDLLFYAIGQMHGVAHSVRTSKSGGWSDGTYMGYFAGFDLLDEDDALTAHVLAVAIPKPSGDYAVAFYVKLVEEEISEAELEMLRTFTSSMRFPSPSETVAATPTYKSKLLPTATPRPCYVGEVKEYLDYPGIAIEVHIFDTAGQPVPGVIAHYKAWNVEITDRTGDNGAVRRDGFTEPITWTVSLPEELAAPLEVKFETKKIVIVEFREKPCP